MYRTSRNELGYIYIYICYITTNVLQTYISGEIKEVLFVDEINFKKNIKQFKNDKGESVRKDAKFDKQYLEGKYSADSYFRKIVAW